MSLFQSKAPYSLIGELKSVRAICRGCICSNNGYIFWRFDKWATTYENK